MRVLVALGGNAMTGPDGSAAPQAQREGHRHPRSHHLAELVAAGHEVVITHGNGPQVGNLLVKNELAASVVPPVPLDWCGAQTQGTIGFTLLDTLEAAFAARGVERRAAAIITRTLVDADDRGFIAQDEVEGARTRPGDDRHPCLAGARHLAAAFEQPQPPRQPGLPGMVGGGRSDLCQAFQGDARRWRGGSAGCPP